MPDHSTSKNSMNAICLVAADAEGRERLVALYDKHLDRATWLSQSKALDLGPLDQDELRATLTSVDQAIAGTAIDRFVMPIKNRRKSLLLSDMDSTVITIECIDELADLVGRKAEISAITERAMAGELDFDASLIERVRCLKGVHIREVERICRERVAFTPGAKTLISTMRRNGAEAVLVSGGFRMFTRYVAIQLGFDAEYANSLVFEDAKLTGEVERPIFGPTDKRSVLLERAQALDIDLAQTMALGDGANDIPMLRASAAGFAYRAKQAVREATQLRIEHTDLVSALYAQGYRDDEIEFEAEC